MSATFRLFGFQVDSELPLRLPTVPRPVDERSLPLDLRIFRRERPPIGERWREKPPIYQSRLAASPHGATATTVHTLGAWDIWSFPEGSVFFVSTREIHVLSARNNSERLEVRLLGPVLSHWLERRGIPVFHGSVVSEQDRAMAFVGAHGAGKTTLAASLVSQGATLLSDDLLGLEIGERVQVRPAYPRLRMRPDLARLYLGPAAQDQTKVLPGGDKVLVGAGQGGLGGFAAGLQRLDRIFVLRSLPADAEPTLAPIAPAESVIELIRHSFLSKPLEVLADRGRRLEALGRVVETVPVMSLGVPEGFEHLGRVRSLLLSHFED